MSTEEIRKFKHELRTPMNHIIGYSELLMETADDEGETSISQRAQAIHGYGRSLASIIDRQLAGMNDERTDISFALRTSAMPVISAIIESASGRDHADPAWERDFARIEAATQRLINIIDHIGTQEGASNL
jgi:signal transduction histidine kinase